MENSLNLEQEWQNISTEIVSTAEKNQIYVQLDAPSHNLMQALLFKLKWKLRWIRIIDIPLLILAFLASGDLRIVLLVLFASYEIFRALAMHQFKQIKTGVDYNSNTLELLTANLKAIQRILRLENIYAYLFLPISGPIGLLTYKLYVHKSFENLTVPTTLFWPMAMLLIIGIVLIYVGKKMNHNLFAAHISALKRKIDELTGL